MNDIIDINVYENTEDVTINVTPEVVQVNVNRVNGGVEYADQTETNAGVISDKSIAPNTLSGWWFYVKGLAQTFSQKITFSLGALFSPQVAPTHERGRIYFDDVNDCLAFMDSISGTTVQIGYETLMRARNNTGATIPNGAVVYISGAIGQNPTIALAQSNTEPTSEIIGVATHNIANNTVGKVCVFGLVNDINTSAFTDGDFLYLSSSVAGGLTTTPPSSPNYVVSVGVVEHAHPTQGKFLVKPQRALSNNNTLGISQKVSVTENVVKTNLDLKQNTLVSGISIKTIEGQSILGSGNIDLNKADVGLSNVDNTSDLNKPISTATQTALDLKLDKVTTVDEEKVYIKNANGTQGVKPTSDFQNLKQVTITTSRSALASDNGCLVKIKGNATYTINTLTLPTGWNVIVRTFAGATATFVAGGSTNFDAPTGLILKPLKMCSIIKDSDDNKILINGETSLT